MHECTNHAHATCNLVHKTRSKQTRDTHNAQLARQLDITTHNAQRRHAQRTQRTHRAQHTQYTPLHTTRHAACDASDAHNTPCTLRHAHNTCTQTAHNTQRTTHTAHNSLLTQYTTHTTHKKQCNINTHTHAHNTRSTTNKRTHTSLRIVDQSITKVVTRRQGAGLATKSNGCYKAAISFAAR